jgi:protein disulfide-isomerase
MASRTSILETIPKVVVSPPKIKPKSSIGSVEKFFFNIRGAIGGHPWVSILVAVILAAGLYLGRKRIRRSRGGYFRLDEKDGLLGGNMGKVD